MNVNSRQFTWIDDIYFKNRIKLLVAWFYYIQILSNQLIILNEPYQHVYLNFNLDDIHLIYTRIFRIEHWETLGLIRLQILLWKYNEFLVSGTAICNEPHDCKAKYKLTIPKEIKDDDRSFVVINVIKEGDHSHSQIKTRIRGKQYIYIFN